MQYSSVQSISGKAFEKVKNKEGLLFITVRPNNIAPLEHDASRTGDVSSRIR